MREKIFQLFILLHVPLRILVVIITIVLINC